MNILIAGGTGLLGDHLVEYLLKQGHRVQVLTRNPTSEIHVGWDPLAKKIDAGNINDTEILINLCGAGIGDKRWSRKRKKELYDSRVIPIEYLFEIRDNLPKLRQFISASGVSCYGFMKRPTCYNEDDDYGNTFVDQLVQEWENAANLFSPKVPTLIVRFGVVLSDKGGAVAIMLNPIKKGFGAILGTGDQIIPWVHHSDVTGFISHAIKNNLKGVYNLNAGNTNNEELTIELAKRANKKIWLPRIPGSIIRLLFGQLSELLLNGVCVDNNKVIDSGYRFQHKDIREALNQLQL